MATVQLMQFPRVLGMLLPDADSGEAVSEPHARVTYHFAYQPCSRNRRHGFQYREASGCCVQTRQPMLTQHTNANDELFPTPSQLCCKSVG